MPPPHPPLPRAPSPTKVFFDPFNSSSTGHQRAENRLSGSTSWRDGRTYKLSHQYGDGSGRGGREFRAGLVGAGSERFGEDGRKANGGGEDGVEGLRGEGERDIRGLLLGRVRKRTRNDIESGGGLVVGTRAKSGTPVSLSDDRGVEDGVGSSTDVRTTEGTNVRNVLDQPSTPDPPKPQIFRALTIYLNGSTAPLISDHKLKHLFAQHGGTISLALGRRTVTHVIIGETCGGGLASTKIEKEVRTVRGKGIKFVTVQWVLDSIERGVRQPERRYRPRTLGGRLGGAGQGGVREMFGMKT